MMDALLIIYSLTGAVVCFLVTLFAATSIVEKKFRAAIISTVILIALVLYWYAGYAWIEHSFYFQIVSISIVIFLAVLFFAPFGKWKPFEYGRPNERVDERDTMFAREEYEYGGEKYDRYYSVHPELKQVDDKIRSLPKLLAPGGRYYSAYRSGLIQAMFNMIARLTTEVDGPINPERMEIALDKMTHIIKEVTYRLGADEVGVARLDPMYLYSHVGRGPEEWGAQIVNNHKFAIVFTLEMDYLQVESAPKLAITEEAARQYLNAALISTSLAAAIRNLGYSARAHISDSNYQVMLPPIARDAGLGELGRFGYLISPKFGGRVRLGGITTNLPLVPDKPIEFGVQEFCETCKKCAVNCPSGAIPHGERVVARGVNKWPLNVEKCITYWRLIGTDCGLCMKVCPFSLPQTMVHNLVRHGIKRSAFARYLSMYGDDLLYGRKQKNQAGERV